jgi:RHS repeat-associated protein
LLWESDTVLNQQISFGYDSFNRLTSRNVYSGTAQNFTYSYDLYGNRWAQTLTAGSGPQPSFTFSYTTNQSTTAGYTYDAAGNMTQDGPTGQGGHTYTYDAEGNILTVDGGSNGQYTYDALNNRVRVQTSAATYEYMYDYAGRRMSSWLNPTTGNGGTAIEGRIYWDGKQIAYRAWDGTTYFDHQDWSSTERMRTNYTGAVAASFTSLPWGDASSATIGGSGAELDNAIFAGLDLDTNTLGAPISDHAQFRNYSFSQGRWLAPDPYSGSYDATNPQRFNRYAYVMNNPLTLIDPAGLIILAPCSIANPTNCPPLPQPVGPAPGGGGGGGGRGRAPSKPVVLPNPCPYQGRALSPSGYAQAGQAANGSPVNFTLDVTMGSRRAIILILSRSHLATYFKIRPTGITHSGCTWHPQGFHFRQPYLGRTHTRLLGPVIRLRRKWIRNMARSRQRMWRTSQTGITPR